MHQMNNLKDLPRQTDQNQVSSSSDRKETKSLKNCQAANGELSDYPIRQDGLAEMGRGLSTNRGRIPVDSMKIAFVYFALEHTVAWPHQMDAPTILTIHNGNEKDETKDRPKGIGRSAGVNSKDDKTFAKREHIDE
jgi:hypothetical protein